MILTFKQGLFCRYTLGNEDAQGKVCPVHVCWNIFQEPEKGGDIVIC